MKHFLDKCIWGIPPTVCYRGVVVEKMIGGYRVLNKKVHTMKQVDDAIDNAANNLQNSIKSDTWKSH